MYQKLINLKLNDIYRNRINSIRRNYLSYIYTPNYKTSIRVILNI